MSALDRSAFGAAVKARLERDSLSTTRGAEASGVTRAQLFRAVHNQPIDAGAVLLLCRWLNVDPYIFVGDVSRGHLGETRGSPEQRRTA